MSKIILIFYILYGKVISRVYNIREKIIMQVLSTYVKKLNIIQQIRRNIFIRGINRVDAKKYENAPEYIKRDREVVEKLLDRITDKNKYGNKISLLPQDKDLLDKLPNSIVFQYISQKQNGKYLVCQISTDKKNSIAIEYPEFVESYYKDILKDLDSQIQVNFLMKEPEKAQYASIDIQKSLLNKSGRIKYAQWVSDDVGREFIRKNPTINFRLVSKQLQEKLIEKKPTLLEHASIEVQENFMENNKKVMQQLLIENPLIISKLRHLFPAKNVHDKVTETSFEKITDINQIKRIFIHSKILGAKGTLVTDSQTPAGLYGNNNITHSKSYSWEDGQLVNKLTIDQIIELIKIDTNYILPRLSTSLLESNDMANQPYFINRNIEESRKDCKQIFSNLYGEEQLERFSGIIDSIYNMQQDYKNKEINHENVSKIPLQQLKILFNTQIMQANNFDEINIYFGHVFNGEDTHESFMNLIKNAYGENAANILRNRTNLDVHEINSLEIFDSRIMKNFSLAFVNDLISYNIEEFTGFLEIVKIPEKLETFKRYYQLLSSNMGENVETMQKAILEYDYVETLIKSLKVKELTADNINALCSFLCSKTMEKFKMNIEELEELQNFDAQLNNSLIDELNSELMRNNINDSDIVENIKTMIVYNIFGIDNSYYIPFVPHDSEESNWIFNQDEMAFIECLRFIKEETNVLKLMEFTKEVTKQKNIRNPSLIYDVIRKLRKNSLELINNRLLTKEKMDARIKELEAHGIKEDAYIYMEEKNGIKYYHLNGIHFDIIASGAFLSDKLSLNKIISHEGQSGTSSISLRYIRSDKPETLETYMKLLSSSGKYSNWYGYTELREDELITVYDKDAGVYHDNKSVKVDGLIDSEIKVPNEVMNEVAIYRRHRNHKNRENEKLGGRNIPDFWIGDVTSENEKILREYNIPVLVIHPEKYLEIQKIKKGNTNPKPEFEKEIE